MGGPAGEADPRVTEENVSQLPKAAKTHRTPRPRGRTRTQAPHRDVAPRLLERKGRRRAGKHAWEARGQHGHCLLSELFSNSDATHGPERTQLSDIERFPKTCLPYTFHGRFPRTCSPGTPSEPAKTGPHGRENPRTRAARQPSPQQVAESGGCAGRWRREGAPCMGTSRGD